MQWRREIRQDLSLMIPEEPPEGVECVRVRVRFGDGERITQWFRPTDSVQVYIYLVKF